MTLKGKKAAELRSIVDELTAQATAMVADLKDDTSADAARKIEADHDALIVRIEDAKRALGEAESTEADEAARSITDRAIGDRRVKDAVESERSRTADIAEIGKRFSMTDELINEHARKGTSAAQFREVVLDALAEAQKTQGGPSGGAHNRGVDSVGQDETVVRREAMEEYIMARNNVPGAKLEGRAKELYRGMTALDLIKETMNWKGESSRGLLADEVAQRGLMTTSDFPNILAAVANKTLRAAYEAAPQTFRAWTRAISLSDFKAYNILRRGETPQLSLVREHGEFPRGAITESKETIRLKTYGVVVGLTRQAIINDDLGALVGIPSDFANSVSALESDVVYGVLLANAALADGVALFHATHANLAASGTAIDIIPLSVMRTKMSKQKGLDGISTLNIRGSILLVPPELETRAEQLLATFMPATNATVNPQWMRSLTPISEARLSTGVANSGAEITASGSATAYYMVSTQVDTIITATLDGQSGPFVENRIGFDVDGVEIKCRHDFAAAAVDFRGLAKDPGA